MRVLLRKVHLRLLRLEIVRALRDARRAKHASIFHLHLLLAVVVRLLINRKRLRFAVPLASPLQTKRGFEIESFHHVANSAFRTLRHVKISQSFFLVHFHEQLCRRSVTACRRRRRGRRCSKRPETNSILAFRLVLLLRVAGIGYQLQLPGLSVFSIPLG